MKGKWINKLLENKKLVRTGCGLMAAIVLASGGWYVYDKQNNVYMPELTVFVDGENTIIEEEEVPLASAPKVTTKTTTKTTTKNVKLKTASKKTYTKKQPTKKSTKTTTKNSATQTVKTKVQTTTSVVEKFTKKSKVKKVSTTVKTVTTTTTTKKATATKAATNKTTTAVTKKTLNINSVAAKADTKLRNAYTKMGFEVKLDSSVNYSGKFDARTRSIILKKDDTTVYHELGHYLVFIAGISTKPGQEADKVYQAEKAKYTGVNKAYVTQNADEYMAEAYRDYCLDKAALKKNRPQTYNLVVKALSKVTDSQIALYMKIYGSIWK